LTDPSSAPPVTRLPSTKSWLVIGVVGGLLVVLYAAAFFVIGSQIPRGTTVAGVDIGGLTPLAAEQTLSSGLAIQAQSVAISVDDRDRVVAADRLGLSFDPKATVGAVPMRSGNPWRMAGQVVGQAVDPVVAVDDAQLDRAIATLARRVDKPAKQGAVKFDGLSVVEVPPRIGTVLDQAASHEAIVDDYLIADITTVLPMTDDEPAVTGDDVSAVAQGAAADAVSDDLTLSVAGASIVVTPEQIADVLTFRTFGSALEPVVNERLLRVHIADELATVGKPARDASFDVSSGKPVVIPARNGTGVTDESLGAAFVAALSDDSRAATMTLERVQADLTTPEAKQLGVKEVISSYTQVFPYAAYRVTNIGVASRAINGTVLEPGEAFSLNGIVGERTPENGFVKGYIIVGNRLVEDYGGAVSTITTAAWHTAFYAGMTRMEQRAHGFWISRYTPGLEATVSWGNLDLKFRNDTPYGVLVTSSVTNTSVTVTMWSTKYWDIEAEFGPRTNIRPSTTVYDTAEGCVAQYGVDGFDITVTRVWSRDGGVKKREPLSTSYDAAPTVICAPKPQPSPKPKPSPSESPGKPNGGGSGSGSGSGSGGGGSGSDGGGN